MKKTLLAAGLSLAIVGCGGGGSSSDDAPAETPATGTDISGVASAPGGAVVLFEQKSSLQLAMDWVVPPVAAAITGLEPVGGATVELIRVDDTGAQLGDVLATAATSLTGAYTLTIPAGVDLSGDLVVRISGNGGLSMRAQVVSQEVNINPVSEYVLQKFIRQGSDLSNLTTTAIIKLSGQVDAFDLAASSDLSSMLESLEQETGAYVDNQIQVISASSGNTAALAGNYRAAGINLGLHDDDQQYGVGTFSIDMYNESLSMADAGDGALDLTFGSEDGAWSNYMSVVSQSGTTISLNYYAEIDTDSQAETAQLNSLGLLSIESTFEEEIDGDFGWRSSAQVFLLQKALNDDIFIGLNDEASVRYKTIDTNDDDENDAIDPQQREGDEVFRSLDMVAKQPAQMTAADLSGKFGRIAFALSLSSEGAGNLELETENSVLTFSGNATLDNSAGTQHRLSRSGTTVSYNDDTPMAETGLAIVVDATGDISSIGGEDADGFVNDAYNFIVFNENEASASGENISEASYQTSLAVKLPSAQIDISSKVYKVFYLSLVLDGAETNLFATRSGSSLTINGDGTTAVLEVRGSDLIKSSPSAEVTTESVSLSELPTSVTVGSDGAATLAFSPDAEFDFAADGYFSADGSIGIFQARVTNKEETTPDELGVMILLEISASN